MQAPAAVPGEAVAKITNDLVRHVRLASIPGRVVSLAVAHAWRDAESGVEGVESMSEEKGTETDWKFLLLSWALSLGACLAGIIWHEVDKRQELAAATSHCAGECNPYGSLYTLEECYCDVTKFVPGSEVAP